MTKFVPSSPFTVSVSPIAIVSVCVAVREGLPDESAIVTEVGVSETSLNTGSSLGKVPLAETASGLRVDLELRASSGVAVVPVPVPVPVPRRPC